MAVEVASHGNTHEEALANLRKALEFYFEDSPVPEMDANPCIEERSREGR